MVMTLRTNREFADINERFVMKLGDEVKTRIGSGNDINVLDIACGSEAHAIQNLTLLYYPHLTGVGLDYHLSREVGDTSKSFVVEGDLFQLPFKEFADIAYCAYVLADVPGWYDHRETIAKAFTQIAGTLKQGGIAFIDEATYTGSQLLLNHLTEKIKEIEPKFTEKYSISRNKEIGLLWNYATIRRIK